MFVARQEKSDDNLLNKVVCSEEEAYALYNNYALRIGFNIQKGKPRYYSGSKNIRQREFLCFKVDEDPCEEKKLNRLETRTVAKHLFVLLLKMKFEGLLPSILNIIMNLLYNQSDIC